MTSALLLLALAQDSVVNTSTLSSQGFAIAPSYAEPNRLAITPKLDGKIDTEEWDELAATESIKSYFQWEPTKIYVAATTSVEQEVLVSLDLKGDGWFMGGDNLELRVRWNGATPEVVARRMVNTPDQGPTWVDAPEYQASMNLAANTDGANWTVELAIVDPGMFPFALKPNTKIGVRVDAVSATDAPLEAFLPRTVPTLNLVWDRSSNMPEGLRWKTEYLGRSVMPGESIKIRYAFDGSEGLGLKRIEMRSEGFAKDTTASQGIPFPDFDRKWRAFVDYKTPIEKETPLGWKVARAVVYDQQDRPTIFQTSYEVSSPVRFDFDDAKVKSSMEQQVIRLSCYIRSNTTKRVNGVFKVIAPVGWEVESGSDKAFSLATPRASKRQSFALKVPAGYKGSTPFRLVAEMGEYRQEQTFWLIVQ